MTEKIDINIDITDWGEDYEEHDSPFPENVEEAVELQMKYGIDSPRMARWLVVGRELGKDSGILPGNKSLLAGGANLSYTYKQHGLKAKAMMPNGKEREVRYTVGRPPAMPTIEEEDEEEFETTVSPIEHPDDVGLIVTFDSDEGLNRATRYLHRNVPGYIMGRLEIIAAHGKDELKREIDWLHGKIDEMYSQLANGG